ncbi:MAG: glutamine synthetase, partial [Clostridia bacterium]|nr:glutamine synthetase [Clostridia bacterium]
LGGGEAPPAIMSIFIGDELGEVVNSIIDECEYLKTEQGKMALGAKVIPQFKKDTTDRNRTSPFAFTGNKFEFRMLGSAFSVSGPNFVLNTIVAEVLSQFADYMETMDDMELATSTLISNVFKNHNRIIFNGNNYSEEWVKEAEKRGLLNLKSTADALPYYITDKNVQLFEKHRIFTKDELYSRYEILTEMYCKTLNIEALTMIDMVKQDIIPAVSCYANDLCVTAVNKKQLSLNCKVEEAVVKQVSDLSGSMYDFLVKLEENMSKVKEYSDYRQLSEYYRDVVIPTMNDLREAVDALEVIVGTDYWPYPSYAEMLFYI